MNNQTDTDKEQNAASADKQPPPPRSETTPLRPRPPAAEGQTPPGPVPSLRHRIKKLTGDLPAQPASPAAGQPKVQAEESKPPAGETPAPAGPQQPSEGATQAPVTGQPPRPAEQPQASAQPPAGVGSPPAAPQPPADRATPAAGAETPAAPEQAAPAVLSEQQPVSPEEVARSRSQAEGEQTPWQLILQTLGPNPKALGLEVRRAVVVGRTDPKTNVQVDMDLTPHGAAELGVSRQHAILLPTAEGLWIVDLDSTNGTWINGLFLQPGMKYRLRTGDRIEFGSLAVQVRVLGEVAPLPPDQSRPDSTHVSRQKPGRG